MILLRRVALALAAGAVAGALLAPGLAVAATNPRVTFTGGKTSGLRGCTSSPDVRSLRVPAETTVLVVNKLHQRAELLVNDDDYGAIPSGSQVGVTVHHGPVRISLVPGCLLSGTGDAVVVEVTGAAAQPPTPTIAPSTTPTVDPQLAAPVDEGAVDDGAVEVTAARPVPARHLSGLLVLVAATLVIGVSIMAIRAKLADRMPIIRSDRQAGLARSARRQ